MIYNEQIKKAEEFLKDKFARLEEISTFNTEKVLNSFKKHKIALSEKW